MPYSDITFRQQYDRDRVKAKRKADPATYNRAMREYRAKPLIPDVDESKRENPYDPRHQSPHGTPQKYRRGGCRCEMCRKANTEAQALTRARKQARDEGVELDEEAWWASRT